ncbi:MAG: 2OG-Fe(II) oxygenase [Myxococcales bacterium]|nr:2OG-Fe(II) oxygenase [Myxococcales bacterium]
MSAGIPVSVHSTPFTLSDTDVFALGQGEVLQFDDMFSAGAVRQCLVRLDALDRAQGFRLASTAGHDPTARGDRTAWEEDIDGGLPHLRALFVRVRQELNQAAWLGLAELEIQLAIYDAEGARYVPHRDAIRGDAARRATAIVYLNPAWERRDGGCLRVHPPSGSRDIEPIGGRMLVFLSDSLLHEVLPSYARRTAATAWYRGRSAGPRPSP